MSEEEHRALVVQIFSLFRQLPDLRSQVDLVGALGKQCLKKAAIFSDWLDTGAESFAQAARFMTGDPKKDGEKV